MLDEVDVAPGRASSLLLLDDHDGCATTLTSTLFLFLPLAGHENILKAEGTQSGGPPNFRSCRRSSLSSCTLLLAIMASDLESDSGSEDEFDLEAVYGNDEDAIREHTHLFARPAIKDIVSIDELRAVCFLLFPCRA